MKTCDPIGTPMDIKDKLDLDKNGTLVDATKYRSMIGALMYLTSTEKHLKEVKRIFRYLRRTINMGLWRKAGQLIPIYYDSKSAIAISCNPVQHSRTKHIAIRYHFIKEHSEKGTIGLFFVKNANLFTKSLPVDRFNYLVRLLGMRSLSPQELERLAKIHQNRRDLPRDTPLDRVEVLRTSKYGESNASALDDPTLRAENPIKEILLKLNLPDHNYKKQFDEYMDIKKQWVTHGIDADMEYDPSDVEFTEWIASKFYNHKTIYQYTKNALWIYWTRGNDEVELTDKEFSDPDNENLIDKDGVAKIFRIETNIFDFETPICKAFNEFNYFLKIDTNLLSSDILGFKTYDEFKNEWMDEWNKGIP
ncbi:hypothetical protein Tco_0450161 [Tanacetum coccineum]